MPSRGCILGICILGVFAFWFHFGLRFVIIPTRMFLGVAFWVFAIIPYAFWGLRFGYLHIRENPDTYAFWGLRFGYLHSGGCDS